jgi:mRNA-degrading endonuclease RelE of RelBE toxin-antitoxin system
MKIFLSLKAERQFGGFEPTLQKRIANKLTFYSKLENPLEYAKFISTKNLFRFRIGDYRALFIVIGGIIHITVFERRDKAYR